MKHHQIHEEIKNKLGIHFYEKNLPVFAKTKSDFQKIAMDMAADADTYQYNPASNGVPAWMTLVNINKIVDQLTIKRAYLEIGEPLQFGNFATNTAQYGLAALSGGVEPYADNSGSTISDNNFTFPTRSVFRGQTNIAYGELETATMSEAKIDVIAQKQYAAATNIAIAQNKLFFFGNLNASGAFINQNFGLLNDPQLNAATPATNGQSSSPLWATKSQSASGATDIANDVIVTAFGVLESQMGGNISLDDEFLLCISTAAAGYFNTTNSFGLNPSFIVKQTLPNLKVVVAPEYATTQTFQLIATKALGENLVKDLFTYKARGHGLWRSSPTSFTEKWSFGSCGCAILNYAPIATISGT